MNTKKVVKIIRQHQNGHGLLESPTYYNLPSEIADEMAKYKCFYRFLHFKSSLDEEIKERVNHVVENPEYVLDFKEQYRNLDIGISYSTQALKEYITETEDKLDKYGNEL
jgi:hypothetical protein